MNCLCETPSGQYTTFTEDGKVVFLCVVCGYKFVHDETDKSFDVMELATPVGHIVYVRPDRRNYIWIPFALLASRN